MLNYYPIIIGNNIIVLVKTILVKNGFDFVESI